MMRKIQKWVTVSLFTLGLGTAMADSTECPSAQQFQNHILIPPYSYQHHKNEIKFGAISWNSGLNLKEQGEWVLVIKSIKASPEDNHDALVRDITDELDNVNTNAYQLNGSNPGTNLKYCLYSLQANEHLSAIAYFIPFDKDLDLDKSKSLKKPVNRLVKALALA